MQIVIIKLKKSLNNNINTQLIVTNLLNSEH